MINFHESYGLPPHDEQEPFGLGDIVTLRPFPELNRIPVDAEQHGGGLVLETRLVNPDVPGALAYQQIRLESGWTASYFWRIK